MEESRRFDFFSLTFFVGFGGGILLGLGLALLAFYLVDEPEPGPTTTTIILPPTATATSTAVPTPVDERPVTARALDVRLGPGAAFAVIGTLAGDTPVNLQGRDEDAEWVAIQFPPGSTGRGWIPVTGLDGLRGLSSMAIVAPTPLAGGGFAVVPSFGDDDLDGEPVTETPDPDATGTPATGTATVTPVSGASDLLVTRVQLLADGRVRVTIGNRGPGDVQGLPIFVAVSDAASTRETLRVPLQTLEVGETVTLETAAFLVDREKDVFVTVDPSFTISDPDRSNNTLVTTLTPPATPTPSGPPN